MLLWVVKYSGGGGGDGESASVRRGWGMRVLVILNLASRDELPGCEFGHLEFGFKGRTSGVRIWSSRIWLQGANFRGASLVILNLASRDELPGREFGRLEFGFKGRTSGARIWSS